MYFDSVWVEPDPYPVASWVDSAPPTTPKLLKNWNLKAQLWTQDGLGIRDFPRGENPDFGAVQTSDFLLSESRIWLGFGLLAI